MTKQIVKNYLQQCWIDFNQMFIAVVKLIAFCIFFAIVIFYNLNINQIDVKTAFFIKILTNYSILNF